MKEDKTFCEQAVIDDWCDNSLDYLSIKSTTEIIDNQAAAAAAADGTKKQIQNKLVMSIHGYCDKKQKKEEWHLLFFNDNNDISFLIVVGDAFVLPHITGIVYVIPILPPTDIGIIEHHNCIDVTALHSKDDHMKKMNGDHVMEKRMN
eukprot:4628734-Ditylum_brightwellii.AAC.1